MIYLSTFSLVQYGRNGVLGIFVPCPAAEVSGHEAGLVSTDYQARPDALVQLPSKDFVTVR